MKFSRYFLLLFIVFNLIGFKANASCTFSSICNGSCGEDKGLICTEDPGICNCFDTGYSYLGWNVNTCKPDRYWDDDLVVNLIQYTCDVTANMHITTSTPSTPYQCVCNSGYYMVDDFNNYMGNPITASGCNSCSGTPVAPGTWTCDGGTTAPHKLCSAYSELYDTGNVIYPSNISGCSCAGHLQTISCTPSCGDGYTGVPGTQPLTDCSPLTYGVCSSTTCDPNTISISYNSGGGIGSAPSTTCTYDGSCDLSNGAGMSKTGYTLTNWNTALNGSGTNYTPGSSHPALAGPGTDIPLYAQWTVATHTIALNDGSGASGGSGTIKEVYGIEWQNSGGIGPITSVNIPTRSGYEFTGYWAASTGGTTPIIPATGSLINPGLSNTYFTANTTIYAQWAACNAGTYEVSGVCEPCNAGYYCAGGTSHDTCPMGHTSAALSDAITDCYITTGPTAVTKFCEDGGARCFYLPNVGNIQYH